jgi:ribosomal protein RSM22 (predicted rRNA methylase)
MRKYSLPEIYHERIASLLASHDLNLLSKARLGDAVLRLSDHYIQNPSAASPLKESWAQAAYLTYYFPLNYARNRAVVEQGQKSGFFAGLTNFIDFGSGLGSASLALLDENLAFQSGLCLDSSSIALDLQKDLSGDAQNLGFQVASRFSADLIKANSLSVFSYVLTELDELPPAALKSEALMIVEPATREDGRKLLEIRKTLIKNGYYIYAPCTHQGSCPLLEHSPRDWCHDRISWEAPQWWRAIEARLPMKNRTITYSYLLARRTPPSELQKQALLSTARIVGDPLEEKGKTRLLICRSPKREFLSWFPPRLKLKDKKSLDFNRGEVLNLPEGLEEKSGELRIATIEQADLVKRI